MRGKTRRAWQSAQIGDAVERRDVTASVAEGICAVHFAPLPQPGLIVSVGDLSLRVDPQTEEVIAKQWGR